MAKFSKKEILMGRAIETDLSPTLQSNLETLVNRLNAFFAGYSKPIKVSSGYRPPEVNKATANASATSWHLQCAAVDLHCTNEVWQYCIENLELAKQTGLWFEDKRWTPTWTHVQIYPPKSGNRIFVPSNKPPIVPKA